MKPYDPHRRVVTLGFFGCIIIGILAVVAWLCGYNGKVGPIACSIIGGIVTLAFRHAIVLAKHRRPHLPPRSVP